jgi:hypothetical protein
VPVFPRTRRRYPPKSASGRRVVPIDATTRVVWTEQAARQRAELAELGLLEDQFPARVFTNPLGATLDSSNVTQVWHGPRLRRDAEGQAP